MQRSSHLLLRLRTVSVIPAHANMKHARQRASTRLSRWSRYPHKSGLSGTSRALEQPPGKVGSSGDSGEGVVPGYLVDRSFHDAAQHRYSVYSQQATGLSRKCQHLVLDSYRVVPGHLLICHCDLGQVPSLLKC